MKGIMKKTVTFVRRLLPFFFFAGILAFASVSLINFHVKNSVKDRILTLEESNALDADCIIILGAGVKGDTPSYILEDRLLQGIELYKMGVSKKLLMSGDHGRKNYDEVNTMKKFAKNHGVPSQDIFMDHAGFSTYETMYRAGAVFQAKKVVIVTQQYHLYRSLYVAKKLGLDAYGVPSDLRTFAGQGRRDLREILARTKDFFTSIYKPAPTYLGDAIPVSGNGDLTND